jgi:hypothetical protein
MRVVIATNDNSPYWERLLCFNWCEGHNFLFGSAQPLVDHPPVVGLPHPVCLVRGQPRSRSLS